MGTFAIENFDVVAQKHVGRGIASNFYKKAPFLAILAALSMGNNNKDALEIGRPNSGVILSATNLSPAERMELSGINAYCPRIQKFKTSNTKKMGVRDVMPTVANPTTNSHGQAGQAAADFRWCHYKTPILIWHEDKIRAGKKETTKGQGIALAKLIDEATEVAKQDMLDTLATDVWNGNPTSQDADLWDAPCGILQVTEAGNTYGRVDRTNGANAVWRGQKDATAMAPDVVKILDDANLDKGLNVTGNGSNLILTTLANYKVFKAQVLAAGGGGVILQNGLPAMAKMGITKEVLQKDNTYIMYDPGVPANSVFAFDLSVWKFIVDPDFNFKVRPFVDISDKSEGAKDADQSFIDLRFILSCDNPAQGAVRYSNVA